MYGTIARVQSTAANLPALRRLAETMESAPGQVERLIFQSDADPHEFWMIALFASKEAYQANAASPEQHGRFLQLRALLTADPEWHDGEIVSRVV